MKRFFKYHHIIYSIRIFLLPTLLFSASIGTTAQCHFIPSTSTSVDTLSYLFNGGIFASYGCAPIDPTYWLSGNGMSVTVTFVNAEAYPSVRVWGMNDDDSAAFEVNGAAYLLDSTVASYSPKVVCGISPGPDGVIFRNGKLVGSNSNSQGNYSYQDVTINSANVTSIKVTGTNGAGWGFAGVSVDCVQLPVAAFVANPDSVCPGTCTDFQNLSVNATSYQWYFPGATSDTSTNMNPVNICYLTPGSYDVILVASNANGSDTLTIANYITVYPYSPSQSILQSGDTLFSYTGFVSYQWFYMGTTIPGATDFYYIASQSGDFSVVCIDSNGCSVEAVVLNVVASIRSAVENEQVMLVFPNPADRFVVISSDPDRYRGLVNPEKIKIYNVVGEELMAFPLRATNHQLLTFDTSDQLPGIYWIEIVSGEKLYRAKFIKQ